MNSLDEMLEVIAQVLIRCVVMAMVVLLLWWGVLAGLGDLAYNAHSRFVPISREQFNVIHYAGMLTTKTVMSMFFLLPYIAIRLVLKKRSR